MPHVEYNAVSLGNRPVIESLFANHAEDLIGARAGVHQSAMKVVPDEVFRVVREEALYDRPIPERHRIIFYVGHVEAFDWNLLAQRAFGLQSFQRTFDHLFAFGIDPVDGGLPSETPAALPPREEYESYN